jgi:hypothetical protein
MYTIFRRYRVRLGTVPQAATYAERTLLPQLKTVPTFVAHYLVDTGENTLVSLTLLESSEDVERAVQVLADWFRSDWPAFRVIPPEFGVGHVLTVEAALREAAVVSVTAGYDTADALEALEGAGVGSDGGSGVPAAGDRRARGERRVRSEPCAVDRRSGIPRRTTGERRRGLERRAGLPVTRRRVAPPLRRREPFPAR